MCMRRINCTLTDAQWSALLDAFVEAQVNWEPEADDDPVMRRRLDCLNRAEAKVMGGHDATS